MMRKNIPIRIFMMLWLLTAAGCASLHETIVAGDGDALQKALEDGADVNASDHDGVTPLMLAAEKNDAQGLQLLLDYDADTARKDSKGRTALDYAYRNQSVAAFRLLLAEGAVIPESMTRPAEEDPFFPIFEEYHLFQTVVHAKRNKKLKAFDAYFSRISDGIFQDQAEQLLERAMLDDLNALGESPDPEELEALIRSYSSIGGNRCLITARTLNIRAGKSRTAERVGTYRKGDVVYCKLVGDGWIETDKGWISRQYTRKVKTEIPAVARWIEKAREHLDRMEGESGIIIGRKPHKAADASPASPLDAEYQEALSAFGLLMEHPTLPVLEQFILTYKDHPRCSSIVKTARETYVRLLLNQ